jgi:transposase
VVARHYDVNANQLFRWRKQYREGLLGEADGLKLLPVEVSETPVSADADATGRSLSVAADGTLEVVLSNQHCLRISGSVCQQSLTTILQVLS